MTMDGAFREVEIEGVKRSGRDLMDVLDAIARRAYFEGDAKAVDFMWYLWCAEYSPLCGRRIKTFHLSPISISVVSTGHAGNSIERPPIESFW